MTYTHILSRTSALTLILTLFLAGAALVFAATDNASSVESFSQGLQKNGAAVSLVRSDPNTALGAPDGNFVSLGFGGELVVGFAQDMIGNLTLTVQEVTGGAFPLETADVYVSTSAVGPWTFVGQASNEGGLEDAATELMVEECYQYVRIVDTTDSSLHNDTADAFDVDSLTAEFDETCPDPAPKQQRTKLDISLYNKAIVWNEVETKADTGDNYAGGSSGGDGGSGGDVENEYGSQDVEGVATGSGGAGGNSGLGGLVQTGDASATSNVANVIGSTTVRVDDCACDGATLSKVRIRTHDFALLTNALRTKADTGDNRAKGSSAGDGGSGGDVENNGGNDEENDDTNQEVDDSTTGAGGVGGNSSDGGVVTTGAASSRTEIRNVVNQTRIDIRG